MLSTSSFSIMQLLVLLASPVRAQRRERGKLAIRSVEDSTESDLQMTPLSTIYF